MKGKINIADKAAEALADKLGVLEEGIPNIRLFRHKSSENGESIMSSDLLEKKEVLKRVETSLLG